MSANFSFSSSSSIFRFSIYDHEDDLPPSGPLCALVPIRSSTWVAAVQFVPFVPALSLIRKFLRRHLRKEKKYPLTTSGKVAR
jgi:hypothetical protein